MITPTSANSAKQKLIEEQVVASLNRPKSEERDKRRQLSSKSLRSKIEYHQKGREERVPFLVENQHRPVSLWKMKK
jgi:hypothetical protein